jgi:hypothetical protein
MKKSAFRDNFVHHLMSLLEKFRADPGRSPAWLFPTHALFLSDRTHLAVELHGFSTSFERVRVVERRIDQLSDYLNQCKGRDRSAAAIMVSLDSSIPHGRYPLVLAGVNCFLGISEQDFRSRFP